LENTSVAKAKLINNLNNILKLPSN